MLIFLTRRKMYWTDWGTGAKIEIAYMSGEQRKTLVSGNLRWPNGITIDFEENMLYWTDAALDRIERTFVTPCLFNGILKITTFTQVNDMIDLIVNARGCRARVVPERCSPPEWRFGYYLSVELEDG